MICFDTATPTNDKRQNRMMIRIAFAVGLFAVAGCTRSNVERTGQIQFADSRISQPDSQLANPGSDDSNSFAPAAPIKVVDEREAAVIAEYIGLTEEQANALAKKQNRRTAEIARDGEPQAITADWVPGRIYFTIANGIIMDAEFLCGLEVDRPVR